MTGVNDGVIVKSAAPFLLTVNGGSSSIKFALFVAAKDLSRVLAAQITGVGSPKGTFAVKRANESENSSRSVSVPDHTSAVNLLMDWLQEKSQNAKLAAVGHRVVHGGARYWQPQQITSRMIDELHQLSSFDPEHLPKEILLAEAFHERFPNLVQVACFDTAFHHDMPKVASLLAIPRRYEAAGVRRYGFHGLSCAYLMEELERVGGAEAAQGRVILAHLGNGASLTAVRYGKSIDTTMSFTPAAGLPMSTRAGDLDPGLNWYLANTEQMSAKQFNHMVNHESGLLGVSEFSSDMRELLAREGADVRTAEAVALFCYQARKSVCALAGALEGLDTLVFAGGIGENAPEVRARICRGMEWMGVRLDEKSNRGNAAVISIEDSAVTVRMIHTDEERVIAKSVYQILEGSN
jgi:acetate kinase